MMPKHIFLTEYQVKKLEQLVKLKLYPNSNEAIRNAVNDLIELHRYELLRS